MSKKLRLLFAVFLLFSSISVFVSCITNQNIARNLYFISSPYAGVDWETFGQFKAALHVHTSNSDGRDSLYSVLEDHYLKGFDIVAITDHNFLTMDWVSARNGLTQERFDEIAAGVGRNGRGMLMIPATNEQSRHEHINTLFVNHNNRILDSIETSLMATAAQNGIAFINHPGRYTGGRRSNVLGRWASNNRTTIKRYVDLFIRFPSCVGMEIINRLDGDSFHDRILWDNILKETVPQGRFVWGFSNDDTHQNDNTGFSFNIMLMPENTLAAFRYSMKAGSFLAVARVARLELGGNFKGTGPVPAVTSIEVDNDALTITISSNNTTTINWIYGSEVIATGNTMHVNNYFNKIGSYVRANIIGPGGIVFTQPFGLNAKNTLPAWCHS